MGITLGELVGNGRTSDVYAYGHDSVVKVPHDTVPAEWASVEAEITRSVTGHGVPAPEVRDVIEIDGRPSIVFERIHGPSLWQQMLETPSQVDALARECAAIHRSLLTVGPPADVPDFVDRLLRKVEAASTRSDVEFAEASTLIASLPRGAALLHGDLHPGNILLGPNGPVVIDWFDATIGHPVADIVRSAILVHPAPWAQLHHLPGADLETLGRVHRGYLQVFADELSYHRNELAPWQALIAAGRIAEHAEVDESGLIGLWNERDLPTASAVPQSVGSA